MNQDVNKTNNNDFLLSILLSPILIFKYAFLGLKAVTYDLFKVLFNASSFKLDQTYRTTKQVINDTQVRQHAKKVEKVYELSAGVLKKLEIEKAELARDLVEAGAIRLTEPVVFQFKVREPNGKLSTGTMNGLSKLDINSFLLNEGYEVFSIKTSKWINFAYQESSILGVSKLNTKELIFFLTQLKTYLKAGLTLSKSISILSKQMSKNKARRRVFQSISYELTLGENFSTSMEKQGNLFPALLINMVKAAEASGTLVETLDDMAEYYTDINTTKKQMISAIAYPSIILVFSIGVITFIMIYVVPQFTQIYDSNGQEIEGLTLFVINASTFIANNIFLLLGIGIGIVLVIGFLYKRLKAFRRFIQVIIMKTPVIKNIVIYNELTILTKTFASLLRNNVYITESVDILSKITNNEIYKEILFETIDNIVRGEKISDAFNDHWAIPDVAYFMIVTGEETGDLAEMMQKVSDYYQESHKLIVNSLKTFIEPILIAFLSIIVGVIIIAVIVPMYDIYNDVSNQ